MIVVSVSAVARRDGQAEPSHLRVRLGVLMPGGRDRGGALGPGGQPGRKVERRAVAGGVFQAAQERVRKGLGKAGLTAVAALDGPADPYKPRAGSLDCSTSISGRRTSVPSRVSLCGSVPTVSAQNDGQPTVR